ncbi:undecaprenyl/decaprenyl-phosphate alpha-N-acetylglucosaminyl 1-phosphate transferase [Peptoniphilus sp. KCTC 25270]|uniref:glycosyltransferase family 4 protein n=1 Tax=Peptoniphilus sp. KCTC 25270 TaxID=2897414 RepID=UPI001E5B9F80|nr:MraY family glycosyltransferase [Peptoniphilus sp. KCTC 25270]MCD1147980.1 undecaprenyl/decaprenyl-phosphate alpha-N-acetylglucosaminyl 1-phosphate transferase [Peptoniphilus sp. KCTC 25270]
MQTLLMPFALAIVISLIATPIVRRGSIRYGLVDIPKDERRMHKKPIPLGGGLAIFIALAIGFFVFMPMTKENIAFIVGCLIIVGTGLYDDKKNMSPKMKFLMQIVAAIALLLGGVQIDFFTNPFYGTNPLIYLELLSIPITIFWVVGITNTINLIDGLDGLACGISAIASISLMFVAYRYNNMQMAILAALLAGSCLGFLPYNFNPARIFMGDTGALLLGFVLSFLTIEGAMKSVALIAVFIPVLILGVPIFDTTFAMIRRKLSGKSITEADKGHLHHRLLYSGLSQRQTVLSLYCISIVFGIIGNVVSTLHAQNGLIVSIIFIAIVGFLALIFGLLKEGGKD